MVYGQGRFKRESGIPVTESSNLLHMPWAGGINFPWISPVDINGDVMKDLYLFDRQNFRVQTFINNGNTNADLAWDYAPEYAFQFPPANKWAFLYDYNCDGKADFFTMSTAFQCTGIMVYKNVTSSGGPLQWIVGDSCLDEMFAGVSQNIFASAVAIPAFNDVDGDGDMDILGYNTIPDGRVLYHKNNSVEDFGVCDSLDFVLASMCYGNFRLKIGSTNTVGCFQCPCRTSRPDTSLIVSKDNSPFSFYDQSDAARRDDTVSSLLPVDIDGDGFKDLLIGDIAANNTLMVHNNGIEMDNQDSLFPSSNTPAFFNGFHYHSFIDVDNDGSDDLLVMANDHENKKGVWYYKNTGSTASPVFDFRSNAFLQKQMIDVGEDACPVLFDYDNDGLSDLVISKATFDEASGNYKTGLYLYKNTGTQTLPSFEYVTNDFAGLAALNLYISPAYPAFGDLDGDNDKDMIIGLEDGLFHYYENTAPSGMSAVFTGPVGNYMSMDAGKYATPQLFDLDRDGKLDIICGNQRGTIYYYKNRGTTFSPLFDSNPTNDSLGCIVLQGPGTTDGFSVPFLYDSAGVTRLLVAYEKGNIFQYTNIDGNLNGCFTNAGKIYTVPESSRAKFNITVNGGDLNGDSLTDIVIGQSTGGAEVRFQLSATSSVSEYIETLSFGIFPNPSNDKLKIRLSNPEKSFLRIINSLGEVVIEKIITGEISTLDVSYLAKGIYFITLNAEERFATKKFIRE